jgi:hypothetical protein
VWAIPLKKIRSRATIIAIVTNENFFFLTTSHPTPLSSLTYDVYTNTLPIFIKVFFKTALEINAACISCEKKTERMGKVRNFDAF